MRRVGLISIGCLFGCAQAPATTTLVPSAAGRRAESAMQRYAMHGMSGSVLLRDSGRVVVHGGYGLADRWRGIRATAATLYDVGSITKTFTAAAILRLVADGRLDLRVLLSRYFAGVPADKASVTVHQVLTHTTGFPLDPANAGVAPADPTAVYLSKVFAAPLAHAPGSAYTYSNTGYGLLAILVERVSGESFRSYVERTLVRPSGLRDTRWWAERGAVDGEGIAKGYEFSDREYRLSPEPSISRGGPDSPVWSKWPLGAAGLISSVSDLDRWLQALASGAVLPDSLTRLLFENLTPSSGNQGYGWTIGTHPSLGKRVYRGGSRTGFTSLLAHYPERSASLAFTLNQQSDANWQAVIWRSLERALAGLPDTLPPATVTLSAASLDSLAGVYEAQDGSRIRVLAEDGALIAGGEGQGGANVMVRSTLDSALVARTNAASLALVSAAARRDSAGAASVRDYNGFVQAIADPRLRSNGAEPLLLGTVPHPSSRTALQTFVRFGNAASAPVLRLIWNDGRVLGWSEGIRMPGFGRFRPTSASSAVAYHPREAGWRTLEFTRGSQVTLTIVHPDGTRSTALQRR